MEKINKKSLLYLGLILVIVLLVFAGLLYYFLKITPETKAPGVKPIQKSIIESLSAPKGGTSKPVSKEVLKSLSAPSNPVPSTSASPVKQTKISEDILKSLSVPK